MPAGDERCGGAGAGHLPSLARGHPRGRGRPRQVGVIIIITIIIFIITIIIITTSGPYALITSAVSAQLGSHEKLKGSKALATVSAIINGTGSVGE